MLASLCNGKTLLGLELESHTTKVHEEQNILPSRTFVMSEPNEPTSPETQSLSSFLILSDPAIEASLTTGDEG